MTSHLSRLKENRRTTVCQKRHGENLKKMRSVEAWRCNRSGRSPLSSDDVAFTTMSRGGTSTISHLVQEISPASVTPAQQICIASILSIFIHLCSTVSVITAITLYFTRAYGCGRQRWSRQQSRDLAQPDEGQPSGMKPRPMTLHNCVWTYIWFATGRQMHLSLT